jgi:hypothetical protein
VDEEDALGKENVSPDNLPWTPLVLAELLAPKAVMIPSVISIAASSCATKSSTFPDFALISIFGYVFSKPTRPARLEQLSEVK